MLWKAVCTDTTTFYRVKSVPRPSSNTVKASGNTVKACPTLTRQATHREAGGVKGKAMINMKMIKII